MEETKAGLDPKFLKIQNSSLRTAYRHARFDQANTISRYIVGCRIIYGLMLFTRVVIENLSYQRPLLFFLGTLVHYGHIVLSERMPFFQNFHALIIVSTFATFIFNPPNIYGGPWDHCSLMVGYISLIYLSSTFISTNWVYSSMGYLVSTCLVLEYFVSKLEYPLMSMAPGMLMLVASAAFNAYHVEWVDKCRFLDNNQIKLLKHDLDLILQMLPEAFVLHKQHKNPHVKYWNNEAEKLLSERFIFPVKSLKKQYDIVDGKLILPEDANLTASEHTLSKRLPLSSLMTTDFLLPVKKLSLLSDTAKESRTNSSMNFVNPVDQNKPISIETALVFGDPERFYQIIDPTTEFEEGTIADLKGDIVSLSVVNLQFKGDACSLILFRNWTHNFKYQFAVAENQMQEMIMATVSHEMRTPINSILLQLSSVKKMLPPGSEPLKLTSAIGNSAQLLLYLVNDMLDVYMLKNDKLQPMFEYISIAELLFEVRDMFIQQVEMKELQLLISIDEETPAQIKVDSRRLKQVIINLLSNSLKFTEQGFIKIEVSFDKQASKLCVNVEDSGCGVKKSDQLKLFKMFGKLQGTSKQNQAGIGLGLNICKQIVNFFNGEMSMNSEPGEGSTFTFNIEITDYSYESMEKDLEVSDTNKQSKRVSRDNHLQMLEMVDEKSEMTSLNQTALQEIKDSAHPVGPGATEDDEVSEDFNFKLRRHNSRRAGDNSRRHSDHSQGMLTSYCQASVNVSQNPATGPVRKGLADRLEALRLYTPKLMSGISLGNRLNTDRPSTPRRHDTLSNQLCLDSPIGRQQSFSEERQKSEYNDSIESPSKRGANLRRSQFASANITSSKFKGFGTANRNQSSAHNSAKRETKKKRRLSRESKKKLFGMPPNIPKSSTIANIDSVSSFGSKPLKVIGQNSREGDSEAMRTKKLALSGKHEQESSVDSEKQYQDVLIVDDNMFNLQTLQTVVRLKFKKESVTASSGKQAIKEVEDRIKIEVRKITANEEEVSKEQIEAPFKIIFMDCNMPQMSGYEATERIISLCTKMGACVPYIVALTAHSETDKHVQAQCSAAGMKKILTKPINSDEVKKLFDMLGVSYGAKP